MSHAVRWITYCCLMVMDPAVVCGRREDGRWRVGRHGDEVEEIWKDVIERKGGWGGGDMLRRFGEDDKENYYVV